MNIKYSLKFCQLKYKGISRFFLNLKIRKLQQKTTKLRSRHPKEKQLFAKNLD